MSVNGIKLLCIIFHINRVGRRASLSSLPTVLEVLDSYPTFHEWHEVQNQWKPDMALQLSNQGFAIMTKSSSHNFDKETGKRMNYNAKRSHTLSLTSSPNIFIVARCS